MPEQLFLCSPLLKDIVHFTTANRPQVIGRLLPLASHLPPNHLTQQPRMKLRKKRYTLLTRLGGRWGACRANHAGGFKTDEAASRRLSGKVQL